MKRVYLASPFFNEKEIDVLEKVQKILKKKGLRVFSPREHQFDKIHEAGSSAWSLATFNNDKKFIDACDLMVCIYHGNYSDSGTAWEVGYAYGTQKPVIIVHVGESSNLMIHEGSHANVTLEELKDYDFKELPSLPFTGKMF